MRSGRLISMIMLAFGLMAQVPPPFRPGEIWLDTSGVPINAHGGGFLYHDAKYFWYGEFKTEGEAGNRANVGISVYSSKDLYHWKNEGIALKVSDDPQSDIVAGCIMERPKVLFNARTGLYVMWFHLELKGKGYSAARAGVATSKSPTGPYMFVRDFRPDGEMSRDMTLFQDDDGKAYLITTSEENQTQHVSELTSDYLDTTGHFTRILAHKALEGEAIFKANGHYFYVGSHTTGWDPNPAFGAVAESLTGPWREIGDPCRGEGAALTFGAQSTYVLPVAGKPNAFIFIADRWRPKNAIDGRYVWLPIEIEADSYTVTWHDSWDLSYFDRPASQLHSSTVLVDADKRDAFSLNGDWHIIADPYLAGLLDFHMHVNPDGYFQDATAAPGSNKLIEYNFAKAETIRVPGDWNTQKEWLRMYEGALWYERKFNFELPPGKRAWLHIGAANYRSRMFINGSEVCEHEGGFTSFDCEATRFLKSGENDVVIFTDNTRIADGVPTLKTDWYNYGGLTRDVSIITTPAAFIDDFDLHLDRPTRSVIEGYVHVDGGAAGSSVAVEIPEAKLQFNGTMDTAGRVAVKIPAENLSLWQPDHPKLYQVELKAGADHISDEIGFRTIEVQGSRILLNGQPIFLRGICVHAEAPYRSGRVNNDADVQTLFTWVQDLGANFVRLAHYPHDVRMERMADKLGILVWSEVPVYWAEQFDNEAVYAKSQAQLREEIRRDRDKASVILWSIANETPVTAARTAFLTKSASYVRELDPTRLVTAALLVRTEGDARIIDDPLGSALDVIGFNNYIGWYGGTPESMEQAIWRIAYDKPLIASEFGGDAKAGFHGSEHERWTEEYQANIFRHQIGMMNRIAGLRGTAPWILMDFRSPVRQNPDYQQGFNRKGLVSDQGEKKLAFGVLQEAYRAQRVGKPE